MIKAVSSGGSWGKFSIEFFCKKNFYVVILCSKKNFLQKNSDKKFQELPKVGTRKIINQW